MVRKFRPGVEVPPTGAAPELVSPRPRFTAGNWMIRVIPERAIYRLRTGTRPEFWARSGKLLDGRMLTSFVRGLQSFYVRTCVRNVFLSRIRVFAAGGLVR